MLEHNFVARSSVVYLDVIIFEVLDQDYGRHNL